MTDLRFRLYTFHFDSNLEPNISRKIDFWWKDLADALWRSKWTSNYEILFKELNDVPFSPLHKWQKHSGQIRGQEPVSIRKNGGIRQLGQPQTQRPELGLYGGIFLVKTKGDRSIKLLFFSFGLITKIARPTRTRRTTWTRNKTRTRTVGTTTETFFFFWITNKDKKT